MYGCMHACLPTCLVCELSRCSVGPVHARLPHALHREVGQLAGASALPNLPSRVEVPGVALFCLVVKCEYASIINTQCDEQQLMTGGTVRMDLRRDCSSRLNLWQAVDLFVETLSLPSARETTLRRL
jgi:hypothetical protein